MMATTSLIDIEVELIHQTAKAWLVYDGSRKEWIPKEAGELEPKPGSKVIHILTIPTSLAHEKGLI